MLQKLIRRIKQRRLIARYYWRWLWMSRAERAQQRAQQKAMRKLLFNLLGNAPMEMILNRESCSWDMTSEQKRGTKEGLQEYVKAVTGENIKMAPEWDAPDVPKEKAKEVSVLNSSEKLHTKEILVSPRDKECA